jgi:hypothetical protein
VSEWEKNWVLVEERFYLVRVFLFDRDNNLIRLTDNLQFNHSFNSDHLLLVHANPIQSELIFKAAKLGSKS